MSGIYEVLEGDDIVVLEANINKRASKGWRLVGPVAVAVETRMNDAGTDARTEYWYTATMSKGDGNART